MPSTRYEVTTSQQVLISNVPVLLQGLSIHEGGLGGVNYSFFDVNSPTTENLVMVIRSVARNIVKIAFPQPVYLSRGLYIESTGGIPTITLELL